MSGTGMASAAPAFASLRQQAAGWWQSRAQRERQMLVLVAAVLLAFLVWSLLVQPALRVAREAPAQIDRLDAQYQKMQRVAAEAGGLRSTPRISPTQAAQALRAATDRLGDRAKLLMQGDRATLTLTGVRPEALRAWLGEARSGARARPVDAQLQRSPNGYSGTLSVAIGSGA